MPKQYGTPGPRGMDPKAAMSESLGRCSVEAQLLFSRLIPAADDQGRMQGNPVVVRALCMPLVTKATPRAVERWLAELARERLVIRYEANGQQLLQIRGWWDHQSNQKHMWRSQWPGPEDWPEDRVKGHGAQPSGGPVGAPEEPDRGPPGAPMPTATLPNATATAGAGPPNGGGAVVAKHEELYGALPRDGKRTYLLNLEQRFGTEPTLLALVEEHMADPNPKTICGRMEARLATAAQRGPPGRWEFDNATNEAHFIPDEAEPETVGSEWAEGGGADPANGAEPSGPGWPQEPDAPEALYEAIRSTVATTRIPRVEPAPSSNPASAQGAAGSMTDG